MKQVMTDVHNAVTARIPMKQLITQYWSAITRVGLTPQEVMGMKAETHAQEISALINATISAAELDQVLFKTAACLWDGALYLYCKRKCNKTNHGCLSLILR